VRQGGSYHPDHAEQQQVEGGLPRRVVEVGERPARRSAAVVDQDVQPAEAVDRSGHQVRGGVSGGHVGSHRHHVGMVVRRDLPRGPADGVLVPGGNDQADALRGQGFGDPPAQSPAGRVDQRHSAAQLVVHRPRLRR